MIYLSTDGRLGNQLFQYAFARKMQVERGDTIIMNFPKDGRSGEPLTEGNQIQYFNITKNIIFSYQESQFMFTKLSLNLKMIYLIYSRLLIIIRKNYKLQQFLQNIFMPVLNTIGLYLQWNGYVKTHHCRKKNIYIRGYFESSRYFDGIEKELRDEFTVIPPPLVKNKSLYEVIEGEESVCVQVRRGDFLRSSHTCDEGYFKKGIEKIKAMYQSAVFIFFSNDIVWCKKIFMDNKSIYHFESGDNPVYETLRLMYSCKHFIISNSTFGWWAQFLSRNPNKTVIAPKPWRFLKNYDSPLLEDYFITIPI